MNMIENIRRIGIFMIAAQTVMHFAAGKQYEKYMKIITGVIVLLMFISPFASSSENLTAKWQAETERMMEQIVERNNVWQETPGAVSPVETVILRQIEEEVKARLNDVVSDDDYIVADVAIDLEETVGNSGMGTDEAEREWSFQRVRIILQGKSADGSSGKYEESIIRIEEITVGYDPEEETKQHEEQDSSQNAGIQEYQHLFAQTLGIADDKVEVTYYGG